MPSLPKIFLTLLASFLLMAIGQSRTWNSKNGHKAVGDLVRFDDDNVTIKFPNGTEKQIPRAALSDEDNAFLEEQEPQDSDDQETPDTQEALNWGAPWPTSVKLEVDPEIDIVAEDSENNKFVYTSTNFRFTCDVRLTKSVVNNFARLFEATHEYCRVLPLALTGGLKTNGKYEILLFENKEDYIQAGGPPGSTGSFIRGRGKSVILIPLISLGVQKFGSGYRRDRDRKDKTLVHEIVHQLTPLLYYHPGVEGWFTEGIAEYLAVTSYRTGRFSLTGNIKDYHAWVTAKGEDRKLGRNLGEELTCPALKDFLTMPYSDFGGANWNFNYGFALLLTTYFCHFDGDGDAARLKNFLKKVHKLNGRSDFTEDAFYEELLDGRTWEELQDSISESWKRKGIEITFREPRGS